MRTVPITPSTDRMPGTYRTNPSAKVARIAAWTSDELVSVQTSAAGSPSTSPAISRSLSLIETMMSPAPRNTPRADSPGVGTVGLPTIGTPIPVPSPLGRLPIQQRSMPVARDIFGGTGGRDEASMVTLRSVRATPAVPERTGDWESVGEVIARLRR